MFYAGIFEEFDRKEIKYLVVGGVAVNLHGFARATGDLDIIISFDKNNIRQFIEAAKILKLKPRVPVEIDSFGDPELRSRWIEEKNMKVFSLFNSRDPMEQLDIILENYIDFDNAYKNREVMKAGKIDIPVISINDLIELKKIAGRERDAIDIKTLEKIKELKDEGKV